MGANDVILSLSVRLRRDSKPRWCFFSVRFVEKHAVELTKTTEFLLVSYACSLTLRWCARCVSVAGLFLLLCVSFYLPQFPVKVLMVQMYKSLKLP